MLQEERKIYFETIVLFKYSPTSITHPHAICESVGRSVILCNTEHIQPYYKVSIAQFVG